MASTLRQIAFLLSAGELDAQSFPWHLLRYDRTQWLWTRLHEANDRGEKLKPATIRKYIAALRGVLHSAKRLGLMTAEDYFSAIDLPGVRGETLPPGRSLTVREVADLLATTAKDATPAGVRDLALLHVVAYTGMRLAEVLNVPAGRAGDVIKILGKGNVEREGFLPDDAERAVRAWLALRGNAAGPLFLRISSARKVGPDRLTETIVRGILDERASAAGVERFTPHDLRRTFATRALDEGADLAKVSRLMGHKNLSTTMKYDRREARAGREVVERLANAYGAVMKNAGGPRLSVFEIFGMPGGATRMSDHHDIHRGWGAHRMNEAVDNGFARYTPIPLVKGEAPPLVQFSGGPDHQELCALGAVWLASKGKLWSPRRPQCTYPSGGIADVMATDREFAVECGVTEPVKLLLAIEAGTAVLYIPFPRRTGLDRPYGFLFERTEKPSEKWWAGVIRTCQKSHDAYGAFCSIKADEKKKGEKAPPPERRAALALRFLSAPDSFISEALGLSPLDEGEFEERRNAGASAIVNAPCPRYACPHCGTAWTP
jgi:site-specific recombinase XerD